MNRPTRYLLLAVGVAMLIGCREGLDFDRSFTADPDRGSRLFKQNCAVACHPGNAFEVKTAKTYEQLAYVVRDYYEQVVGPESGYSQQDIFDMTRFLNDKYYGYRTK